MDILLITNYFPPEIGAASHLFYDLAKGLSGKGHNVTVLTGFPRYNIDKKKLPTKYRNKLYLKEKIEGVIIKRFWSAPFPQSNPVTRGFDHLTLPIIYFLGGVLTRRHDIVLIYSPPLTLGVTGHILAKIKWTSLVINVQDIFPQNAIDLGILKNRFLIRFFQGIERFVYGAGDCITVHSERNRAHVVKRGGKYVKVISNMVDTEFIKPMEKDNLLRTKNGLQDKFVVSFAGTMGYSQDLDVVLECAKLLDDYADIFFLLVGDGIEKERLLKKAENMGLSNVLFLPMQQKSEYPKILAASDVSLVTLKKAVKTPVVPSKILSIMASGRPVIGCMDLAGDAPELIDKAGCGFCVEAENPSQLSEKILKLYRNRKKAAELGRSGRKFTEENLSKDRIINEYEKLFIELTER